jgi:uncharacterized SAM-binding protein YcdF (DUF218 family)
LGLGIANLWRQRRESRRRLLWVTVPFVLLSILSIPAVAFVALGTLEWSYPPSDDLPENPQVLVVLSGYMYAPDSGRRDQAELSGDTYYRCRHALRLYRKAKGCPILVSGGISDGAPNGPPLADAMRDFFLEQGVKASDLIVENRSLTTYENALESCKLLRERGIQRIVLITDARHTWRSLLCFQKQGMDVVPSACNSYTARFRHTLGDYLPSPRGAARFLEAFHEWLGVAFYKLRGWV